MSGQTSQLYIILVHTKPEKYNTEVFSVYIVAQYFIDMYAFYNWTILVS